jgi:outer membrane receptor protein involved in Fe transport
MSYGGKYNLRDKIWINAALLTYNKQYYRDFIYGEAGVVQPITISRELKGIADMNLGAEYRYTKLLGMFVQLNNIFNVRYERYKNYPMQRFNVMAGVSYTF